MLRCDEKEEYHQTVHSESDLAQTTRSGKHWELAATRRDRCTSAMWPAAAMKEMRMQEMSGTSTLRGTVDCSASATAKERWRKGARQGQRKGWQGRERQGGSGQGRQRAPKRESEASKGTCQWLSGTVWDMRRVRQKSRRTLLVVGRVGVVDEEGKRRSGPRKKKKLEGTGH